MNSDLETLQFWRAGEPSRALSLHGPNASQGVTLTRWRSGEREQVYFSSAAAAVTALAASAIRWRAAAPRVDPQQARKEAAARGRWGKRSAKATPEQPKGKTRRGGVKARAKREAAKARKLAETRSY